MEFSAILEHCTSLLKMLSDTANTFLNWLFTEIDAGILGTIEPISLVSFTVISTYLIARIIINALPD